MAANAPVPATANEGPLSAFERLSQIVYLYRPPPQQHQESWSLVSSPSPKLILLAGWMDAREPHLAKYTAKLQALFPASPVVLIRSFAHHFHGSIRHLHRDLEPAVALLHSVATSHEGSGPTRPDTAELLILAFSNGGSKVITELYGLASGSQPSQLPAHVTIFDSAPSRFQWLRGVTAFSMGAARSSLPVRLLALLVSHCLAAMYWLDTVALRRPGALEQAWAAHNDKAVNTSEVQRVYIYSKEDELVDFQDVRDHAAEAEVSGFAGRVRLEEFTGTAHVAHARGDEQRYWRIVRESWEAAAAAAAAAAGTK
ncbi:hypothetical protein BD289DRAFT_479639 [Coniella lustricola]|uniref:Indole-diterpene biosynthesis protein PaxU n=1 Tax=Coniella lustricola TaxID=2025994 RepID=A0A2T3AIJ9_9PEZI|nr:hypothetical protein BD289DRAFT_479639 [Coniella lustricola]